MAEKQLAVTALSREHTRSCTLCQGTEKKVRVIESSSFREVGLNQGKYFG